MGALQETLDYSQPRLLVVDDNRENRTMLARRLMRDGYQIVSAGSGEGALEQLELQPVALVLLDVQMPDMDGLQVLDEIRKSFSPEELPVWMVSANTEISTKVAAMERGANDYLHKPVEYEFLLAKLKSFFKRSGQVAPSPPRAAPAGATTVRLEAGEKVGKYELLSLLGEGGMGKVFRARDTSLLRDVALKVMGKSGSLERFLNEARAVARISHPGIATIYEIGEEPLAYIAMELVTGDELQRRARGISTAQACDWAAQIAETLHVVHQHGILHRDLKPANILVTRDDRIKVMDFGLAKLVDLDQKLTRTGELWGTPHYMSPEHFDPTRGPVDAQSDVFALSAILYELLTGRLPFPAGSMGALVLEIMQKDPDIPSDCDAELARVLRRGLAKDKADRYPDAASLAADLRAVLMHL